MNKYKVGDRVFRNGIKFIVDFEFGGWVALKGEKYSVRVAEIKPIITVKAQLGNAC